MSDEHLLIDGELERIVNETHERIEKAQFIPNVTSGPVPEGLRRTLFGMAWKSGVPDFHVGFPRNDENAMLIVGATITYMHVQSGKWNYKVSFERRGMTRMVMNKAGEPEPVFVPGRSSERSFGVTEVDFRDSFEQTAPMRKSSHDSIPESWPHAVQSIRTYSVSFKRLDRQDVRMTFDAEQDRIEVGIAKALCRAREIPKLVEPRGVTAPAQDADFDGAVMDALGQLRRNNPLGQGTAGGGNAVPYTGGF